MFEPGLTMTISSGVKFSFKDALRHFKKNRKYLPRDNDLKQCLKTQFRIYSSCMETLKFDAFEFVKTGFSVSQDNCWEFAMAIQQKLKQITNHTEYLRAEVKAGYQLESITNWGGQLAYRIRYTFHASRISTHTYRLWPTHHNRIQ
ncbi:hypothetical protein N7478_007142 [Penicillium angulare]|uniref:uncharacterized protein n=1 Tax=Penicillium angulare TaxID=116970 RepID=UPI00254023AF|nr:uncharacterized protein N7478_007142 [Penicillium angulare]KAJ5281770.1 hypothetical protein N7478_007142 [Penicillium angulare]